MREKATTTITWSWLKVMVRTDSVQRKSENKGTYTMVQGKAVVDPSRQDDHVPRHHLHADPLIVGVTHVKVAAALHAEPDLLIRMKVLPEEVLQLQEQRHTMLHPQEQKELCQLQKEMGNTSAARSRKDCVCCITCKYTHTPSAHTHEGKCTAIKGVKKCQ